MADRPPDDAPEGNAFAPTLRHPGSDLGPRAQRAIAKILDATRSIFLTRGYAGTTIDEIARTAGISRASVYTYFPTKRDVLLALGADSAGASEAIIRAFSQRPRPLSLDDLCELVEEYLGLLDVHGPFAFAWTQAAHDDDEIRTAGMRRHLEICGELGELLGPTDGPGDPVAGGLAVSAMLERSWSYMQLYGDELDGGEFRTELARLLHHPTSN